MDSVTWNIKDLIDYYSERLEQPLNSDEAKRLEETVNHLKQAKKKLNVRFASKAIWSCSDCGGVWIRIDGRIRHFTTAVAKREAPLPLTHSLIPSENSDCIPF